MAKISIHPIEEILNTANQWKLDCLIKNGSIFSSEKLWTLQNIAEFENYFSNNPIIGNDKTFYQKLKSQLKNSPPEIKQLASELLYVILLFPRKITSTRKAEDVALIWSWSGKNLRESFPNLENSFAEGVGSTGMAYNSYRSEELVFFTKWLSALKAQGTVEREELLSDPWIFGNWLDSIDGSDRRQFRHIALFLLFPDFYETCSSKKQKNLMLSAFKEKIGSGNPLISTYDSEWVKKDKNILFIREQLTAETGAPINFYLPPYLNLWIGSSDAQMELDEPEEESEYNLSESNDFQDLRQIFLNLQDKAKEFDLIELDQEIPFEFQELIRLACEKKYKINFGKFSAKFITIDTKNKLIIPNIAFYMSIEALELYHATEEFNSAFKKIYQRLKAEGKTSEADAEDFYVNIIKPENLETTRKDFDEAALIYLREIGRDSDISIERFNKFINIKNWKSAGIGKGKNPGRPDTSVIPPYLKVV
jgi:hypothetical protein